MSIRILAAASFSQNRCIGQSVKAAVAAMSIMSMLLIAMPVSSHHDMNQAHAAGHEAEASISHKPRRGKPQRLHRVLDKLDLTAEQRPLVRTILREQQRKRRELREDLMDQLDDQRLTLDLQTRERLRELLNAEQVEAFDNLRATRSQHSQHSAH